MMFGPRVEKTPMKVFPRVALLLPAALLVLWVVNAFAQSPSPPPPDAVEEDWQLVIATPDPLNVGPQITTVMSTGADLTTPFFAFDMNYREYPFFSAGGLQVQIWSGGNVIGTSSQGNGLFNTTGESVTWTQRMSLGGGQVTYDINNGQSTSWGQFGQGNKLNTSYNSPAADLSAYDPDVSAANSGASWQSNHVTSLTLVQVRYYANGQLINTDTTPRTVVAPSTTSN